MNSLILITLSIVSVQSFLFTIYIVRNGNREIRTRYLILLTSILSLHFLNLALGRSVLYYHGFLGSWILLASYGPSIFLYARTFVGKSPQKPWLYFVPSIYPLVIWLFTDRLHMESSSDIYFDYFVSLPIYGSVVIYLMLSLYQLYKNKSTSKNVKWLKRLVLSFIVVLFFHFTVLTIYSSGNYFYGQLFYLAEAIYMMFFSMGMVYTAMSKPSVFIDSKKVKELLIHPEKYIYTGLTKEDTSKILSSITLFMDEHKPYLDSEITLDSFAEKIGINRRHISQAINEKLERNFKEFVNQYRIMDAIEMLDDPERDLRIFEVMYQVGFSSKSSFNQAFKKATNKTPTEYRCEVINKAMIKTA